MLIEQAVGYEEVETMINYPIVVSTWPFVDAVKAAWSAANSGLSAVDAVVEGCSACEELRCDGTGSILYIPVNLVLLLGVGIFWRT